MAAAGIAGNAALGLASTVRSASMNRLASSLRSLFASSANVTESPTRAVLDGPSTYFANRARAFQLSPVAGAYAGLAMCLNGLLTAIVVGAMRNWF